MKISNNALNFLLAQYRAIFKRAYVKGIASAVLLTAGLAVGQAQAATPISTAEDLPTTGDIKFTGTGDGTSGNYSFLHISSGTKTDFAGDITIQSGTASTSGDINFITGSNPTTITGTLNSDGTRTGSLTIDIKKPANLASQGLLVAGYSATDKSGDVTVNIGTIDIKNGILKITDLGTTGKSGTVSVQADSITIGDASGETSAYLTLDSAASSEGVTLGRQANTITGEIGSTITVNSAGKLSLSSDGGSGTFILGDSLTVKTGALMITEDGDDNVTKTKSYKLELGAFKVVSGNGTKETFAGHTASIAGNLSIGSGAEWVLAATDDTTTETVTEGTTTFESGANVQVGGTLTVSGGTLTVADGAQLVATEASDGTTKAGTIVVTKNSTNEAGTLKISSADLKDFLTAKDASGNTITYNEIKTNDDDKYIVDTETDPAPEADKGSILLSGGILELSDINRIDLADGFSFSGGATNGKAGMILVGSSDGGTVKGHDLMISKALSGGIDATKELTVEADILTIGGSLTSNTETKLSDFKVKNFKAHDEVILDANDGSNEFTIDQTLTLERDFYNKNADGSYNTSSLKGAGTIKGDNLVISGSATTNGIKITGGQWTNESQSLTIQSGTLSVAAVAPSKTSVITNGGEDDHGSWNIYRAGNPAELTWHGALTFSGSAATNANLKVSGASGANAVLDLTKADITWGSGSITLSGEVEAGSDGYQISKTDYFERAGLGVLKLEGDQVIDFLGLSGVKDAKADTTLKIEDGGLLLVNGNVYEDLDVASTFAAAATAKQIWLSGGNMFVTGSLSLVDGVNGHGGAADATANGLTIDGILGADTIYYTNESTSIDRNKPETDVATVSGGTLAVASSFSSKNHEVKFVSGAGLLLDSKGFLAEWDPETAGEGGTVSVDHLTFSGVESSVASKLDVQTGAWTIDSGSNLGDVDILDGAVLNVGPGHDEFIRTGVGASLALDNLTVTNAASTNSGTVTVDEGGELTVNTIQMEADSKLNISGGATVTITGDYAHNLSGGKLVDGVPEGLTDLDATNVDKQAGINLEGADITLNSGKLHVLKIKKPQDAT